MGGTRHNQQIKHAVLALGARGATYTEIRKLYPIPKSTLSFWFHSVGKSPGKDRERMLVYLVKAREAAVATIRRQKEARLASASLKAEESAKHIDLRSVPLKKALAAMLYWAEGAKTETSITKFANTDPLLASFYLQLLRTTFPLDESKLRVRLHLHHYHSHKAALDYWSKLLRVPKSQFGKIHVKKRSARKRFRKNFQGICFIIYHDVSVRRELMALGRLLAETTTKSSRS